MNPLIARFRAAAVAAGRSLNCGSGRLDREFGLSDFLESVADDDDAGTVAELALEHFCKGAGSQQAVFRFGVFAVCQFLHAHRGGAPGQFPTAAAHDLVSILNSGWNSVAIEQCLQSHFG